jgi:hypothetical protein
MAAFDDEEKLLQLYQDCMCIMGFDSDVVFFDILFKEIAATKFPEGYNENTELLPVFDELVKIVRLARTLHEEKGWHWKKEGKE